MLVGVYRPEALDDVEGAAAYLSDVDVHPHVVLAGHHLRRAARAVSDLRVVERRDDGSLVERAGFGDGGLPELDAAVDARAPASGAELGAVREARVVAAEQLPAERVTQRLVVVDA